MKLIAPHGSSLLAIPQSVNEIRFGCYLNYEEKIKIYHFHLYQKEQNPLDIIESLISAVSEIIHEEKEVLMQLPFTNRPDKLFPQELNNIPYEIRNHLSITSLHVHIRTLIEKYKPEVRLNDYRHFDLKFEGKVFDLDYQMVLEEMRKQALSFEIRSNGVLEEVHRLKLKPSLLAKVLRLPGEILPMNKKSRRTFLIGRMNFFKDLPLSDVMDISTFITKSFSKTV